MKLTTNEISLKMAPQTFTNHNALNFYIPFAVCFETAWSVFLPKIPFRILLLAPVRCAPFPIVPSLFKEAMILGLFDTASQTIFSVVFINIWYLIGNGTNQNNLGVDEGLGRSLGSVEIRYGWLCPLQPTNLWSIL